MLKNDSQFEIKLKNVMVSQLFDNQEIGILLTAEELGAQLNVSPKTIRKWRYERVLPDDCMLKLRSQVRFKWEHVLLWLKSKDGS